MKFMVLKPIWSNQHQAYFMPGAEIDLDVTEQEAAAFAGVLQPLEIAGVLQPLEIVDTTSKDQGGKETPAKKVRK